MYLPLNLSAFCCSLARTEKLHGLASAGQRRQAAAGEFALNPFEARALPFYPKLATIAQTTVLQADYLEVVEALKARADVFEDRGRVCGWTLHAQDEALALAQEVDAMVVVGGRDSSNTIQLVRVCETACPTFHVESPDELRAEWFSQASVVGIAAGASTREVDLASSISFLESLPAAPGAVAVA